MIVPQTWDNAIAAKLTPARPYATAMLMLLALAVIVMAWKLRDHPAESILLFVWLVMP